MKKMMMTLGTLAMCALAAYAASPTATLVKTRRKARWLQQMQGLCRCKPGAADCRVVKRRCVRTLLDVRGGGEPLVLQELDEE